MIQITELLSLFHKHPSVSTDTRKIRPGDLFFALKGDRFDGNKYAADALEKGAARVIMDNPEYRVQGDERYILVENSLQTLQQLGTAWRREFDIPVIGITGTNGKTTTKELIYAALSQGMKTYATSGNFNNHIGVPLTLLGMPKDIEIAIVEMGANQPGDIRELSEIAEPTHGIITNIGYAHLERFVNIDGVQKTKGELFDFISRTAGTIFLNLSDHRVVAAAKGYEKRVTFGQEGADYHYVMKNNFLNRMQVEIICQNWEEPLEIDARITGSHNCMNILVAVAIADFFGVEREKIRAGIESYVPANNRSQVLERANYKIWLDAYNANPSSMRAAIDNLFSVRKDRIVLILGDMFEMGENEVSLHRELGEFVNQHTPQMTLAIGPLMKHLADTLTGPARWFESVEDAREEVPALVEGAELVLIKGSRGMALERLVEVI